MEGFFGHEKLEAYKVAKEFLAVAVVLLRGIRGAEHAKLRAQLSDAADSILFNTAEGAGRASGRDKAKFFDYARGSATECAAALDSVLIRELAAPEVVAQGRALLHRAARLLTGLSRAARARDMA